MSFTDATIARLPRPIRPYFERHHELIKFAIVGATTFIIDSAVFYTLKLTVLEPKPVTAKIIAGIVAVIASYILNREWSFRNRGGRERHHEALLFFAFSGVGVLLSMAPLWFSSYVLQLRVPDVSLTVENIADFISAYIIGNLLQMGVPVLGVPPLGVPRRVRPQPGQGDRVHAHRRRHRRGLGGRVRTRARSGTVTPLRRPTRRMRRLAQLGDSSEPRVSKTS